MPGLDVPSSLTCAEVRVTFSPLNRLFKPGSGDGAVKCGEFRDGISGTPSILFGTWFALGDAAAKRLNVILNGRCELGEGPR